MSQTKSLSATIDRTHREWLRDCYREAVKSPDRSTQIGVTIFDAFQEQISTGFNGFTKGFVPTEADHERPRKYQVIEHAERRAIYSAADQGYSTRGGTMVATWAACSDCARAIVECGLSRLIRHYPILDEATERWLGSITVGDQILKAGGVEIIDIVGRIPGAPAVVRDGKAYFPDGMF